jgi:hypothetical protein
MALAKDLKFLATVDKLAAKFSTSEAVSLLAMSTDRAQRRHQAAQADAIAKAHERANAAPTSAAIEAAAAKLPDAVAN